MAFAFIGPTEGQESNNAQGMSTTVMATDASIMYSSPPSPSKSFDLTCNWELTKQLISFTTCPTANVSFTFVGKSVKVMTNSDILSDNKFSAINVLLDGKNTISKPPFISNTLFSKRGLDANASHTLVMNKVEDDETSILAIASISFTWTKPQQVNSTGDLRNSSTALLATTSTASSAVESGSTATSNASKLSSNSNAPLPARTIGIVIGTAFATIALMIIALSIIRLRRNRIRNLRYREKESFKVQHSSPSPEGDISKCSDNKLSSSFVADHVRTVSWRPTSSASPTHESPDDEIASLEVLPPTPSNLGMLRRS
ncbi:hypothetical protein SCHPADRAFT_945765 [Schizopora paradoxa]|uniref:Uncharacterized protein n=1 Tax=Schizopora paradoxa TaxID=27342 RepID=A0A0H2RPS7_9AGAM|nr:hypothetical protein SCHPADRAFT_945765 [Schizopora paradoxa]